MVWMLTVSVWLGTQTQRWGFVSIQDYNSEDQCQQEGEMIVANWHQNNPALDFRTTIVCSIDP